MIDKIEVLEIARAALKMRVYDAKMLLTNLDLDSVKTQAEADAHGVGGIFAGMVDAERMSAEIALEIADLKQPKPWRMLRTAIGKIYICPKCDRKTTEKTCYCPHCGQMIGADNVKAGVI